MISSHKSNAHNNKEIMKDSSEIIMGKEYSQQDVD